jgi:hypothetical protein
MPGYAPPATFSYLPSTYFGRNCVTPKQRTSAITITKK